MTETSPRSDDLHVVDASCKGNPGSLVLEANGTLTWTPLQVGPHACTVQTVGPVQKKL